MAAVVPWVLLSMETMYSVFACCGNASPCKPWADVHDADVGMVAVHTGAPWPAVNGGDVEMVA